jgi:hypothetical protein
MLTLYCDDSGTHSGSAYAVAACFLSDMDRWDRFNDDWSRADRDENFGVFHMTDFVAKKERFALPEWQDECKRRRTMRRLINISVTRRQHAFVSAIEKAAYDAEVPEELRQDYRLCNNHYTFAVRHCMGKLIRWRQRHNYTDRIQFVFDRMTKGHGEIIDVFERALEEGAETALSSQGIYPGGWSFQDKAEVLPLQAADILAWESMHFMQKVYLPEVKEKPRKSYLALIENCMDAGYYDRQALKKYVAHVMPMIRKPE